LCGQSKNLSLALLVALDPEQQEVVLYYIAFLPNQGMEVESIFQRNAKAMQA
jgi:hypothetical protein